MIDSSGFKYESKHLETSHSNRFQDTDNQRHCWEISTGGMAVTSLFELNFATKTEKRGSAREGWREMEDT